MGHLVRGRRRGGFLPLEREREWVGVGGDEEFDDCEKAKKGKEKKKARRVELEENLAAGGDRHKRCVRSLKPS